MTLVDVQNFPQEFPRIYSQASQIKKTNSSPSRTHLAVSSEQISFQINKGCFGKSIIITLHSKRYIAHTTK